MIKIPENITKATTLFLDRDGVINVRRVGEYITNIDDFIFLDDVPQAIAKLNDFFGRIIIVSNQQGIGKNIMTFDDLDIIHDKMVEDINRVGGRIDKIFVAPNLKSENNRMRKPNSGMALAAQKLFPEIDFENSIMVGDTLSDMVFGKRLKMTTVIVGDERDEIFNKTHYADYCYKSLADFAEYL